MNNLLLITSNQGAGGWRLSRLLSCHQRVYWFKTSENGEHPWSYPETDSLCYEKAVSKHHYDREFSNKSKFPVLGERIAKFWDDDAWIDRWYDIIDTLDIDDTLFYPIVVHDTPKTLREWFPDSTIINLIDDDPLYSCERHLTTSANFRINYHFSGMKPDYENEHQRMLNTILSIKPNAVYKDIYLFKHHHTLNWDNNTIKQYEKYERSHAIKQNNIRVLEQSFANFTMTWHNYNPISLESIFGTINENYKRILL